jgi:hypothetical protein
VRAYNCLRRMPQSRDGRCDALHGVDASEWGAEDFDPGVLAIRMDPDVKAALEERATAEDRSLSWYVNHVLRQHFGLVRDLATKKKAVR